MAERPTTIGDVVIRIPGKPDLPEGTPWTHTDPDVPLAEDVRPAPPSLTDLTDDLIGERVEERDVEQMPDVMTADRENEAARSQAIDEETQTQVTDSGVMNSAGAPEQYDFRQLVESGGNLKSAGEEQGVDLPNEHWKPMTYGIAGIDVVTGERVTERWNDDDGFIAEGVAGIRESTSNTAKGPPVEDIESLANIAYGVQQEGASLEEYKKQLGSYHSDENIQRAWNATQRVRMRESLEEFGLDHGEAAAEALGNEPPLPELPEPLLYEELTENTTWMAAAQTLWNALEGDNPVVQGIEGEYFAEPEDRPPLPPDQLSDWLITKMSSFNWNVAYMAYLTTRVMNGDENFKMAAYNAMTMYDNLDSAPGQTGRAIGYVLADPLTYMSFGSGTLAAKAAAIPMKSMVAKIATGGAAGGALEGGLFMGVEDSLRQTIEMEAGAREERDLGQTAGATAMGVGAGATLGGTLAVAASKPARKLYMRAGRRIKENAFSVRHMAPGTPMAQTGSLGDQAAGRAHARAGLAREKLATGQRSKINDLDVVALLETSTDHTISPVTYHSTQEHVRKTLKRKDTGTWEPNYAGARLCDDDGCVELGLPTTDHWLSRVEEMLSPEEIQQAKGWYGEIVAAFEREFGDDGQEMMTAWLMSNQNVDPAGALHNALRVKEQVGTGAKGLLGGLSDASVRQLFRGTLPTEGMGLKLHDFIDSAHGKDYRTAGGNIAEMGAPAVIDVHSARDMGYVDPAYRNYLVSRFGKDAVEAAGIPTEWGAKLDFGKEYFDKKTGKPQASGGVSDTQYEHAANHMRAMTDELNAMGFAGGDLTPMQVQAIGWTAQARRTGSEAFNAVQSIDRNTRQLSYELSPGAATEFEAQFGKRFDALDYNEKSRVTRKVTDLAAGIALTIVKPHEAIRFYGPGGWMDFPATASTQQRVVSSKEAAQDMGDVIGYLLQQTEVFITKPIPNKTGWKAALDIVGPDFSNPEKATEFWIKLQEKRPKLKGTGFSPMRERHGDGIRVVFGNGGEKFVEGLKADMLQAIEEVAEEMGLSGIKPAVTKVESESRGNKWNENPKGEGYLDGIEARYGSRVRRTLERDHRRNVAQLFSEELDKAEARAAGKKAEGVE